MISPYWWSFVVKIWTYWIASYWFYDVCYDSLTCIWMYSYMYSLSSTYPCSYKSFMSWTLISVQTNDFLGHKPLKAFTAKLHHSCITHSAFHNCAPCLTCFLISESYTILGHIGPPSASNPGWDHSNPWKTEQTMSYQHVLVIYVFERVLARRGSSTCINEVQLLHRYLPPRRK